MCKSQLLRVQAEAGRKRFDIGGRIEVIAKNGMTDRQEMHAQLMAAAGDGGEFKARASGFVQEFKNAPPGHAGTTVHKVNNLQRTIDQVLADWQINLAALFGWMASGNGDIGL